jgi:hypothetical protein
MKPRIAVVPILVLALTVWGFIERRPGLLIPPVAAAESMHGAGVSPLTEPGNDAFGTIQEVMRALEADPHTDWSNVNLEALREHLVDMNNMTLNVTVLAQKPIANGVEITVAPNSADVAASLDRVFAAHPPQLEAETGWKMSVRKEAQHYRITVTTSNPAEVAKIRGLGYIGILASGAHHQAHHWAIARGFNPHQHHHDH